MKLKETNYNREGFDCKGPGLRGIQDNYKKCSRTNSCPMYYHSLYYDHQHLDLYPKICYPHKHGWPRWTIDFPDCYVQRRDASEPLWYQRRVNTIRCGNTKERLWSWELTDKPTEKRAYGISREPPRPWQRGYQAIPHDIVGQIPDPRPRYGLFNPSYYQGPGRVEPVPPVHVDQKHL